MNIVMMAAENDALEGAKVGGIADVVRDIAPALAVRGHQVNVVLPGYQQLSKQSGSTFCQRVTVHFWGRPEQVELFRVPGKQAHHGVTQWVLEHPLFAAAGKGRVYCDDPPNRPFATDASKFSLFCAAAAEAIQQGLFAKVDILHLHDWHAAMTALLRASHPHFQALKKIRTVFSIHNLALQGIRPLKGDSSSLDSWFPGMGFDYDRVRDPRYHDCVNLMRIGVNLSDAVHAVSPTYVSEITRASDHKNGFFGGEGLEKDLQQAQQQGRLYGILNGADYSGEPIKNLGFESLLYTCQDALLSWTAKVEQTPSVQTIALTRVAQWLNKKTKPKNILTSVGRLTDQKVLLLRQTMSDDRSVLDHLLDRLGERGCLILLGSGDRQLEQFMQQVAGRHANFLFLCGFSVSLSEELYAAGDLFLMPSSFEPCGISQMLSMRAGQPCLVHAVGGLADTINDGIDGFSFRGDTLEAQAEAMLNRMDQALEIHDTDLKSWRKICKAAADRRFLWDDSAALYETGLYKH